MAKLTYKQRKALPTSDFAVVQKEDGKTRRRFPINDKAHARNALARLPQAKGLSTSEKAAVKRKAYKKLGKKDNGSDYMADEMRSAKSRMRSR